MPSVGKKDGQKKYMKSWCMEPLAVAQLASLTPQNIQVEFFDDRIEDIDYNTNSGLVAINIETYTARRAYEIAKKYKDNGKMVVMGGFHATLMQEEVLLHADAVVVGEAEKIWIQVIDDFKKGELKKVYKSSVRSELNNITPDRTIYKGKKFLKLGLIETGRGCNYNCDFCSIASFYRQSYRYRPINDIVSEIKKLNYNNYFFVDDNICNDTKHAKELFKALIPLKIKWISQASINIAKDEELLELMKKSGCQGVLIGFESLDHDVLQKMNKKFNSAQGYKDAINKIHNFGIRIYATFVFGYGQEDEKYFKETYKFAISQKFFMTAFNHLVPFPGTPLYNKLKDDNKLLHNKWWLNPDYTFGQLAFRPESISPNELSRLCYKYRKKFYSWRSIFWRLFNFKTNFYSMRSLFIFFSVNIMSKIDVKKRQGLVLGKEK
jgi:radical SAM superfamily enzyme YgiQ (UPF0313 family)